MLDHLPKTTSFRRIKILIYNAPVHNKDAFSG